MKYTFHQNYTPYLYDEALMAACFGYQNELIAKVVFFGAWLGRKQLGNIFSLPFTVTINNGCITIKNV